MAKPFALFLALKYLRPKRTFVSVVTLISVIGVMLGVAVLIIVLSVMSGFDDMWRDKILGFNAHITVESYGGMSDYRELIERIEADPEVSAASPYCMGLGFIQHNSAVHSPFLKGIEPALEERTSRISEHMVAGEFEIYDQEVLLGRDLAERIGVWVGDQVLVYSPQQFARADEFHLPEELRVAGIFDVGMWDFDMGYLLCSMDVARELVGIEEGVQGIQVMTEAPYKAEAIAARLRSELGGDYLLRTWMERNRQLFAALRVEKNMMFFLLMFITLVAAFSIMNTLITVTVQKTPEIGLLKALGFSSHSVMWVFFWQGWISGLIGLLAGTALGLYVVAQRNNLMRFLSDNFNLELFPKDLYRLSEIPASTNPRDLLVIALTVMVICTLAGIVPAWRAARLNPAEALRHE
jgi:lipoprotein-releasing system permease protein